MLDVADRIRLLHWTDQIDRAVVCATLATYASDPLNGFDALVALTSLVLGTGSSAAT